jgi:hypothetical protein
MQATPNIGKVEHNNVDGIPNVSHIKIAKKTRHSCEKRYWHNAWNIRHR